jgi:hypothetical protein
MSKQAQLLARLPGIYGLMFSRTMVISGLPTCRQPTQNGF